MTYAGTLPKALQVGNALAERFRGITTAAGYHHDVQVGVYLYETEQLDLGTESPAIAIEVAEDALLQYLACAKVRRRLTVNVWFADRVAHDEQRGYQALHWGNADIVKAIQSDTSLGGLATYIDVENEDVVPIPDSNLALGRVALAVVYDRLQADPTV